MPIFRLLQIGDVHFDKESFSRSDVDLKDNRFSPVLIAHATTNPLQNVTRMLSEVLEAQPVDAILIVGDLTDRGDFDSYEDCVNYLITNLRLEEFNIDNAHCVPGNHDINKNDVTKSSGDENIWEKFTKIKGVWDGKKVQILEPEKVRTSVVKKDDVSLKVASLNSCVGCWEYYGMESQIKDLMRESTSSSDEEAWKAHERVDTPFFDADHINDLTAFISDEDNKLDISVVLSHHNLLPQALPVIAPYSELLNGGGFRSKLAQLDKTIIYCHGHIHKDPIEIVGFADEPCNVVCISAPELISGFNIINVHTHKSGIALGLEVLAYRSSDSAPIKKTPSKELKIPLKSPKDYKLIADEKTEGLIKVLRSKDEWYGSSLMSELTTKKLDISESDLIVYLTEMDWLGVIELTNTTSGMSLLKIKSLIV